MTPISELKALTVSGAVPVAEAGIAAAESQAQRQFPDEYRAFLQKCGGRSIEIEDAAFSIGGPEDERELDVLFGLDELAQVRSQYAGRLEPGLLAIGSSGSGANLICLSASGSIAFWDHEAEGTLSAVSSIAADFGAFLNILRPRSPSSDLEPGDVVIELDPSLLK